MKKIVALIMVILMAFPTYVRAENVDDVIPKIIEVQVPEAKAEDWNYLVERFRDHEEDRSGDVRSIDQIAWLVQTMEKHREESVEENHPLDILLGIGIWENDTEKLEKVESAINKIVEAFEAKTGARLLITKTERSESYYFEVKMTEKKIGESAVVKKYDTDGRYFESAWGTGTGRFGKIGNDYVSENDQVILIKVAYLNEKDEVVEVVSEPGVSIDSERRRMILIQKGDTILGWISPYNIQ